MSVPKTVSLRRALDLLRLPGARMMKCHDKDGVGYYVLGAGKLTDDDAHKILRQPNLIAFEDGLFPGNSQGWRLG